MKISYLLANFEGGLFFTYGDQTEELEMKAYFLGYVNHISREKLRLIDSIFCIGLLY